LRGLRGENERLSREVWEQGGVVEGLVRGVEGVVRDLQGVEGVVGDLEGGAGEGMGLEGLGKEGRVVDGEVGGVGGMGRGL